MAGCQSIPKEKGTASTLLPKEKEIQNRLFLGNTLSDTMGICETPPDTLDGGGPVRLKKKGVSLPPLSMDWVLQNNIFILEVADPTGAGVMKIKADDHKARINAHPMLMGKRGKDITLKVKSYDGGRRWTYKGQDLFISHRQLACLLSFGIPNSWLTIKGRWFFTKKASLFRGKIKPYALTILHRKDKGSLCMQLKKKHFLIVGGKKTLKICYPLVKASSLTAPRPMELSASVYSIRLHLLWKSIP